jgi:hypothetical protein
VTDGRLADEDTWPLDEEKVTLLAAVAHALLALPIASTIDLDDLCHCIAIAYPTNQAKRKRVHITSSSVIVLSQPLPLRNSFISKGGAHLLLYGYWFPSNYKYGIHHVRIIII